MLRELGRKLVENNIVEGKEENFNIYHRDTQSHTHTQPFWIFNVKYAQITKMR